MRNSRGGVLSASLVMAAAILGGNGMMADNVISAKNVSSAERQASEAVKAEKKSKQTKAARLGYGYYLYFNFPRSRKTTTAARLKRASTKRRNIEKRGRK